MSYIKSTLLFLNNIYNNKRLLLVFIFLVSLLVSLIFLIFLGSMGPAQHAVPGTDYLNFYEPVANNILQGKGITLKGELAIRYPPGYPIILAIIFGLARLMEVSNLGLIIAFNVIMTAGAACFLFLIAKSVFNRKIAFIASLLWLSYPFNLWFLKNPNSEIPFIFLLYAGIWLYLLALKKKRLGLIFLSGLIFGLASLIRPIGLLLPFILALLIFLLLKKSAKSLCFLLALALLIGNFIAILPWEAYVFSRNGEVILLSSGGPTSVVDGFTFALKPGEGDDQITVSNDIRGLMERAKNEDLSTGNKIFHFVTEELANNPITFLKLLGWKLIRSWYATSQMWWEGKILLVQLIYLIPGLLGTIYAFRKYKDKIYNIIFILSIILYFWFMTFLVLSILRYMVPAMGIMMIFSAVTINILINKLWRPSFQ